ncbi:MAG: hypothetical protein M1834_001514 [Cirrosporium novae-zelandiae]|nr:MAG: hypothetical protein M1834_004031 [Cirrosporium novae-zelandiae]KAI9735499.1 MAG: hypothetical protein M1834_001514 [Cirrosporium novae-zelandiae]
MSSLPQPTPSSPQNTYIWKGLLQAFKDLHLTHNQNASARQEDLNSLPKQFQTEDYFREAWRFNRWARQRGEEMLLEEFRELCRVAEGKRTIDPLDEKQKKDFEKKDRNNLIRMMYVHRYAGGVTKDSPDDSANAYGAMCLVKNYAEKHGLDSLFDVLSHFDPDIKNMLLLESIEMVLRPPPPPPFPSHIPSGPPVNGQGFRLGPSGLHKEMHDAATTSNLGLTGMPDDKNASADASVGGSTNSRVAKLLSLARTHPDIVSSIKNILSPEVPHGSSPPTTASAHDGNSTSTSAPQYTVPVAPMFVPRTSTPFTPASFGSNINSISIPTGSKAASPQTCPSESQEAAIISKFISSKDQNRATPPTQARAPNNPPHHSCGPMCQHIPPSSGFQSLLDRRGLDNDWILASLATLSPFEQRPVGATSIPTEFNFARWLTQPFSTYSSSPKSAISDSELKKTS